MSVSPATSASLRRRVLASYKMLLRLGQTWVADDPQNTADERKYITAETKTQFRKNAQIRRTNGDQSETTNNKDDNSGITDNREESEIAEMLREVEARVEMARHYKNPYPRAINLPPMGLAASLGKNRRLRGQKKLRTIRADICEVQQGVGLKDERGIASGLVSIVDEVDCSSSLNGNSWEFIYTQSLGLFLLVTIAF